MILLIQKCSIISKNRFYAKCVDLDIPFERFSKDNSPINNYGYRHINLCKSTGLCIANGRCASDKRVGSKYLKDKKCHRIVRAAE